MTQLRILPVCFGIALFVRAAVAGPDLATTIQDTDPANPRANAATRAVLHYFQGLSAAPQRRIVSGQFSNFGRGANLRAMTNVFEKTGHWPAIIGVDYADLGGADWKLRSRIKPPWPIGDRAALVTISAHLYDPASTNGGGLRDKEVNLASLLAANEATHTRWLHELDLLAAGLQELRASNVVVLWRPFHEMNGDWFWWGGKDPGTFIQLWRRMFDYFTIDKGLDNLIWVYSPNHGPQHRQLLRRQPLRRFGWVGCLHGFRRSGPHQGICGGGGLAQAFWVRRIWAAWFGKPAGRL